MLGEAMMILAVTTWEMPLIAAYCTHTEVWNRSLTMHNPDSLSKVWITFLQLVLLVLFIQWNC